MKRSDVDPLMSQLALGSHLLTSCPESCLDLLCEAMVAQAQALRDAGGQLAEGHKIIGEDGDSIQCGLSALFIRRREKPVRGSSTLRVITTEKAILLEAVGVFPKFRPLIQSPILTGTELGIRR